MSFLTLRENPSKVIVQMYERMNLPPMPSIKKALKASHVRLPVLKVPDKEWIYDKAWKCSDPLIREGYFIAAHQIVTYIESHNTKERFVNREARRMIKFPIDLSLRQLSFIAKMSGRSFPKLLREITNGEVPIEMGGWKRMYDIEKLKHKETKKLKREQYDEMEAMKKKIAKLRNKLHEEGIEDPTIQH